MIRQLTLQNWQSFRGKHVLELEPKAYAIVAKYDSDPGRSNMAGKSALLEAVEFAMMGTLNKYRPGGIDGWITRGEPEGKVSVILEDGSIITRSKRRGQATQVRCTIVGSGEASQNSAEERMLKYLSFGEKDFRNVAYFAQGAMAKLIRTEAEKRFEIIRGWLNLEKAEEAEERAGDLVKHNIREVQRLKQKLETSKGILEGIPTATADIAALTEKKEKIEKKLKKLDQERSRLAQHAEYENTIDRFRDFIKEGKDLDIEIAKFPDDLEEQHTKASKAYDSCKVSYANAVEDRHKKKVIAQGAFDGACPVADITCPVTKTINADRLKSKQALQKAETAYSDAQRVYIAAQTREGELALQLKALTKLKSRRDYAKEKVANLRDDMLEAKKRIKDFGEVRDILAIDDDIKKTREEYQEITRLIVTEQHNASYRASLTRDQKQLEVEIDRHAKDAALYTQTRSVFRATQRRLAERALNAIKHRSNTLLGNSGIDLSVDIQWEREGKDPAKTCEMCGMAFPSSAKVKVCQSCGAERGKHVVQKLEFLLSDRSGAADDFAGIALQLAAGSWLLSKRESPWATAMIDEPFAQMDKTIRRAASRQLLTLLGASAFRQVFVISHSEDTVSMYPAHINIRVAKDGTRSISTS